MHRRRVITPWQFPQSKVRFRNSNVCRVYSLYKTVFQQMMVVIMVEGMIRVPLWELSFLS